MKKTYLLLAAMALILASCDTETKDSYQTIPYPEYNLIIDNHDVSAPAIASYSSYEIKLNISRGCIDVKTSDLILNNQKYSFETDTMAIQRRPLVVNGNNTSYLTFSKSGPVALGSAASDIKGTFVACYVPQTSDILNPSFTVGASERLDLSYTLNDRYSVQTFWPSAYYKGTNIATSDGNTFSSEKAGYMTRIDFEKKKASVYVYNAEFAEGSNLPKVMRFDSIPVVFSHHGFTLQSDAPKTQVLGIKDNRTALVDSVGFEATDFNLTLTSGDLTDVAISYKLAGHQVSFRGCSIIK